MRKPKIACVVGARPNFMKIAPILAELENRHKFQPLLIHTGQHSSPQMADVFFRDLGIRSPDVSLGITGGTPNDQNVRVMQALEPLFAAQRPDLVLVVGDVNATLAAALVAARSDIRLAHVEAGLRSFDRTMPEEINRIVTDTLSDYLFITEPSAEENLLREGIAKARIIFAGNVMIDTLLRFRDRAAASPILDQMSVAPGHYALVTLHRPSNVDDPKKLGALLNAFDCLAERLPVIFPMHPRTQNTLQANGLTVHRLRIIPPLGYIEFLRMMSVARLVLTDSGGMQEETTILGVTCLTIRENTERPITVSQGTNRLVGTDPGRILQAAEEALERPPAILPRPDRWDGQAAARIVEVLDQVL